MSDPGLLAWGRAAVVRRKGMRRGGGWGVPQGVVPQGVSQGISQRIPVLWLFTDTRRLPDPRPSARRLPVGIAGVVFRHDDHPDRATIGRDLARICRQRRLALVVAGDSRLAASLGAGVHLRGGHWPGPIRRGGLITSSAHDSAQLRRARRNGAVLAFLSPAFPTASHSGEPALGAVRWNRLARSAGMAVAALGGIDGKTIGRLRRCAGAAAIGALSAA